MATKKFAGPSPYVINTTYPEVDFRHTEYINNATAKKSRTSAAPVVAAIFGLGRAGSIHLSSIIRNPRIILKYIVDDRPEIFTELKSYWKLEDQVVCLTSKNADRVYKDKSSASTITSVHGERGADESVWHREQDASSTSCQRFIDDLQQVATLRGGVFHDCVVHDFDIACWILGELPVRVHATASGLITEVKAIDDFDNIAFLLTYPSGTVAIGDNSRFCAYGYDQRLEVFGNKGMIKVENEKPAHSLESYIGQDGIKLNPIYYSFPSRYKIAYRRELEHFLDVVQYGVPIEVSSWQTLAISKIATAAEESARTGKTVELDWSKDGIPAEYS
ncbi:jg8164 [Pararge aegeria aegeria]|uniref:Jg8164 protein n=1 Tax=Pararge aegeria aegeria TaxID=348720 RepID=A0A8S4SIG3_9NEOP|nr:jg8164 [Pararge aegeria aegeria]